MFALRDIWGKVLPESVFCMSCWRADRAYTVGPIARKIKELRKTHPEIESEGYLEYDGLNGDIPCMVCKKVKDDLR